MSTYPAPPTFGVPFNPSGRMEPPVGSHDHAPSQYSYPYQSSSLLYGQSRTNGMAIAPHTNSNTHSFHTNAQGVTTPSSGNEVNGPSYALHGGPIQYNSVPTPPYPQSPFAHGPLSYGAQHFSQPYVNSNLSSNPTAVFPHLHPAAEVQSTNIEDSDTVPPASPELEDGELDDGEITRATGQSRASTTTPSGVSQDKRYQIVDSGDSKSSHRVTVAPNAPNKTLPGLIQVSLATPKSQDPNASQTQRYSTSNGFNDNPDDSQFSRIATSTSRQRQLSTKTTSHKSKEVSQQFEDQKVEEAKQALRDLHSQGFDFNQIVSAGLNPGVLRKLYTKIEVPVTASSDLPQRKIANPGVTDVPTKRVLGEEKMGIHDRHPEPPRNGSHGGVLGNDNSPQSGTEEIKINSQPVVAAAKNEGKPMQSQVSFATTSKSSIVNPLGKASGTKAGETKILDRKEYIARMLAAKAGKPAVSATIPVSLETSTVTESGASAQVRSSATAATNVPPIAQQASSELVDAARGGQKEDSDVEAKRKAQTDLARQKIMALKQQARSATSSDVTRNDQQIAAKGASNFTAERSVPTPQPLPSRQSSYFSPASQKPPFSIPGLFMTPDAPEAANPSQLLATEGFPVSLQGLDCATSSSPKEGIRPHAAASAQSPILDKTSSLPEKASDLNPTLPASISAISSNRKRQKASDFIDSPSTRVKRPLGQQEDTSVIIDISDDEVSNEKSEDESLDTEDIPNGRDALLSRSQVTVQGSIKENPTKSLLPLTEIPQRKKTVTMTSPAAPASGQSGDLKGLRSKEMEIEVMNRKIAKLEQRIAIKAKQSTSRNHSPGTPSRRTVSPTSGEASHEFNSAPKMPLSVLDLQNGDVGLIEEGDSLTALAQTKETAAAEQLDAEQQLEQVERAKAEAERSLATEVSLASAADQAITQEEKTQSLQAEEQSDLREGERELKGAELMRVQDEEERPFEESQARPACGEEAEEIRKEEADRSPHEEEQRLSQDTRQEHLQEQERTRSLEDQRQARKSKIESALPLLDAEIERTTKRLESLRQEIADLETQVQKGIEGRQGMLEELYSLTRSREEMPEPMDLDSGDISDVGKPSKSTKALPSVKEPSASVEMISNFDQIPLSGTAGNGGKVPEEHTSMRTTDHRISDDEVEEDIMDTSRSDVDEAELSLYSPKAMTEIQDASNFGDEDEYYEPPSEISVTQRLESDPDPVTLYQGIETAKTDSPVQTQNLSSVDQNDEAIKKPSAGEPSPVPSVNTVGDELTTRSPHRVPSPANASDPDDYEPPEPAPLGDNVSRPSRMSSVDSERPFSPPDVQSDDFVAQASSDSVPAIHEEVQKHESQRKSGHFTPYESPLKQFKSFRYHPRFLEEVTSGDGYRSMTFSHQINPDIPLCRYELDGVCNDDSCQSQHLRSAGLSDDKILVDLGAKPNGSSPDEFGNGLKEIIHDIRSRKLKSFTLVAGEITAYRAKFLGDNSKILPL